MPATAVSSAARSSTAITSAPAFLRAADTAATCSAAPVTATVEPTVSPLRRRCHPIVANDGSGAGSHVELVAACRNFTQLLGLYGCLLYTSDAADDLTRVDLGGRRIIKK